MPSVHLLDPAAASALEINDTKVRKLQTRSWRATIPGTKPASGIQWWLCYYQHLVIGYLFAITALHLPVIYRGLCSAAVGVQGVYSQMSECSNTYCSLIPLTICFPKSPCPLSVGKSLATNQGWHCWMIWDLLSALPNFCCLIVGKTGRLVVYILILNYIDSCYFPLWLSKVRCIWKWLVCVDPSDLIAGVHQSCESRWSYTFQCRHQELLQITSFLFRDFPMTNINGVIFFWYKEYNASSMSPNRLRT